MKDVEVIKARNTLSPRARTNFEKRLRVAAYCRVSTDTEDQLNSYKSQVEYYTELIKSKPEWSLAGIYADEAITGTQVKKREDFQRLINDCMNGDVDMVITKSISRFARNTLDTLKYVRMLKDKGVAVFFEEENINTLTMDGELLLVILSSVAQQEVENISANVKKGLKMKMQRGELVGFQGCLGYDYNPEDKTLTVNEEEAAVDMRLEDTIDKETYDRKYLDLSSQIEQLQKERESLQDAAETESTMRKRVATFRQTLEQNEVLDTFDRHIFESIVEKVIVGGYDSNSPVDLFTLL